MKTVVSLPILFAVAVFSCTDTPGYLDYYGYVCASWRPWYCWDAVSVWGATMEQQEDLLLNCCASCQLRKNEIDNNNGCTDKRIDDYHEGMRNCVGHEIDDSDVYCLGTDSCTKHSCSEEDLQCMSDVQAGCIDLEGVSLDADKNEWLDVCAHHRDLEDLLDSSPPCSSAEFYCVEANGWMGAFQACVIDSDTVPFDDCDPDMVSDLSACVLQDQNCMECLRDPTAGPEDCGLSDYPGEGGVGDDGVSGGEDGDSSFGGDSSEAEDDSSPEPNESQTEDPTFSPETCESACGEGTVWQEETCSVPQQTECGFPAKGKKTKTISSANVSDSCACEQLCKLEAEAVAWSYKRKNKNGGKCDCLMGKGGKLASFTLTDKGGLKLGII